MTGGARVQSRVRQSMVWIGLVALGLAAAPAAKAEDFDGSKTLLCAPVEAIDCVPGRECVSGTPTEMGAPAFFRIDFGRKLIIGPRAEAKIASRETTETQLLLQGIELGLAYGLALDRQTGRMTATLNDPNGAIVLFGSCTPL
jgi:hypothetical protein